MKLLCLMCNEAKSKHKIQFTSCKLSPKHLVCIDCQARSESLDICPFCFPLDCTQEKIEERALIRNTLEEYRKKWEEERESFKRKRVESDTKQFKKLFKKCEKCFKPCAEYDDDFPAVCGNSKTYVDEKNELITICSPCSLDIPKCRKCCRMLADRRGYCNYCFVEMKKMFKFRRNRNYNFKQFMNSVGICSDEECQGECDLYETILNFTLGEKFNNFFLCNRHYRNRSVYCQCCSKVRYGGVLKKLSECNEECKKIKCDVESCFNSKFNNVETCYTHAKKCKKCVVVMPSNSEGRNICQQCKKIGCLKCEICDDLYYKGEYCNKCFKQCVCCNEIFNCSYEGLIFICFDCQKNNKE